MDIDHLQPLLFDHDDTHEVTSAEAPSSDARTSYDKVLTICLPTYNRAECLKEQMERLLTIQPDDLRKIEIIVSDNCSPDHTPQIVEAYRSKLPFIYLRNQENIGPDRNFLQCLRRAQGKYVWLLGDDDFLQTPYLHQLLQQLESHDFGLVHIRVSGKDKIPFHIFTDLDDMLCQIAVFITFMSSNIVSTKLIPQISLDDYFDTHLLQVPLYLQSALEHRENMIVNLPFFDSGAETQNNGGYNLFEVFGRNLSGIYDRFEDNGISTRSLMEIKRRISDFLFPYWFNHVLLRRPTHLKLDHVRKYLDESVGIYLFILSGFRFIFSAKMIRHWLTKIGQAICRAVSWLISHLLLLVWPHCFARGWRNLRTTIISHRFRSQVKAGKNCHVTGYDMLSGGRYVEIGNRFNSLSGLRIECIKAGATQPSLKIGDDVTFNQRVHLGCIHHIEIGDRTLLGSDILITDHSHGTTDPDDLHKAPRSRSLHSKGSVVIGSDVWIGDGAKILPGVTIGQGAVIGAGAIVTHSVPAYAVVAGNPAHIIRLPAVSDQPVES